MDQKRFLLFIVLSLGILIGWNAFVMPRFLPPPKKPNAAAQKDADNKGGDRNADGQKQGDDDKAVVADNPEDGDEGEDARTADGEGSDEKAPAVADKAENDKPDPDKENETEKPAVAVLVPQFPEKTVELGAPNFASGFCQFVTLTSRGAAVQQIQMTDPRYVKLQKDQHKVHPPLVVVGENDIKPPTLGLEVPQVNADLNRLSWELVELSPAEGSHSVAVFRIAVEDLEITKRYELPTVEVKNGIRNEAPAYSMKVAISFRNLGRQPRVVNYILQGPTGLPLENVENTQKFRDVVVGFLDSSGAVDSELMTAKAIADKIIADGKGEEWKRPMKYIGINVQFFAALVCPVADQRENSYTKSATQQLIRPNQAEKEKSEISVQLTSVDLSLEGARAADGKNTVTHEYTLFAGPKRDDVLPAGCAKVIDFGWFHWISRPMLSLLKGFHSVFGSWGIAIICLTIVVRSAMFPISIRQARGAAKMQALQPEIAAIKEKYGKDKEKLARAQMELFRKHGYNPAAGCLPLFLQLPIFMGLYQALNHAVDLRMASFLWIENLAAPDALFRMPVSLPLLGQNFNLLPIITTGLFYVQQKMFMPPPANDEQAMQQKMMNFMMIFMGVMFYKVPAGLCVYFIASSLWGMGEKKLLPKAKPGAPAEPPASGNATGRRKPPDPDDGDKGVNGGVGGGRGGGGGLWAMLLKAAEKESSARRTSSGKRK
jgi:YidC/Oxa1 family membrane protein insertase